MAKLSNLKMVQNILSSMDSDNVNSIDDVEESQQVLEVIEETYYNILSRREWYFLEKTRQLQNAVDASRPNKFLIPENVTRINCFRYKKAKVNTSPEEYSWTELEYLRPNDFIELVQSRNSTVFQAQGRGIITSTDGDVEMFIFSDKEPEYYTSFDDKSIYLDSWVSNRSTTVIQGNTSIDVQEEIPFEQGDTAIQNIPVEMFPLLLAEAKSACWVNFKGIANPKAEQIASRLYIKMREEEPTLKRSREWLDYGKPVAGTRKGIWNRGLSRYV